MTAQEYLDRFGRRGLRSPQLDEWVRDGGDLRTLVRLVWASQPVVQDDRLDMRLVAGMPESDLAELGRLALDWFMDHPDDDLAAEIVSQVSFQAPWIIRQRIMDFARATAQRQDIHLNTMLLEGLPETTLLELAALSGINPGIFVLVTHCGSEAATRLGISVRFPDMDATEQEDAVDYALWASGVTPGNPEGRQYAAKGCGGPR